MPLTDEFRDDNVDQVLGFGFAYELVLGLTKNKSELVYASQQISITYIFIRQTQSYK